MVTPSLLVSASRCLEERSSGSQSDSEDERAATAAAAADVAALRAAPAGGAGAGGKKRKRRATYHVRKDEIETLQQRMEDLEHELRALKYQALVHNDDGDNDADGGASSQDTRDGGGKASNRRRTLAKSSFTRHVLGDALRSQQFALAGLQAMVSTYASLQEFSPVHTTIHLGRDPAQRQQALVSARERVLKDSKRFIAERCRGMDVFKVFSEQERYEARDGNYCALGFDIVPLGTTSKSVKRVFDTLFFQIRNIEITFSEMMGHIAIRENDDTGDAWLSQHRLVAAVAKDARIETNVVVFADFESGGEATRSSTTAGEPDSEEGEDSDFGIIVLEWIDEDELYPYRPKDRARRDTSCIFTVQVHSRKREPWHAANGGCTDRSEGSFDEQDHEEKSVVLKRWSQTKLRNVSPDLDMRAVQEMRASIGAWGDRMVQAMYESAHRSSHIAAPVPAPASATPPPPGV